MRVIFSFSITTKKRENISAEFMFSGVRHFSYFISHIFKICKFTIYCRILQWKISSFLSQGSQEVTSWIHYCPHYCVQAVPTNPQTSAHHFHVWVWMQISISFEIKCSPAVENCWQSILENWSDICFSIFVVVC